MLERPAPVLRRVRAEKRVCQAEPELPVFPARRASDERPAVADAVRPSCRDAAAEEARRSRQPVRHRRSGRTSEEILDDPCHAQVRRAYHRPVARG